MYSSIERDVCLAERRALEQLGSDRRLAREGLGELQAEFADVAVLVGQSQELRVGRESLGAEIVLGVNVCDGEIPVGARADFGRLARDRLAVAGSEPGVDHQGTARPDDDPHVRNEWHILVRNHVNMRRELRRRPFADDRIAGRCSGGLPGKGLHDSGHGRHDEKGLCHRAILQQMVPL